MSASAATSRSHLAQLILSICNDGQTADDTPRLEIGEE
jgi:hypothetical protein